MTEKKTIELTKKFNAPVAVLFDAIKNGQLLISTNVLPGTFKHDFRVGGEYSLEWTCAPGSLCKGRYLAIVANKEVKFTWNPSGTNTAPSGETTVTLQLTDHGKTSEMKLLHEGLDAGLCYEDHLKGWTSCCETLVAEVNNSVAVSK